MSEKIVQLEDGYREVLDLLTKAKILLKSTVVSTE